MRSTWFSNTLYGSSQPASQSRWDFDRAACQVQAYCAIETLRMWLSASPGSAPSAMSRPSPATAPFALLTMGRCGAREVDLYSARSTYVVLNLVYLLIACKELSTPMPDCL